MGGFYTRAICPTKMRIFAFHCVLLVNFIVSYKHYGIPLMLLFMISGDVILADYYFRMPRLSSRNSIIPFIGE